MNDDSQDGGTGATGTGAMGEAFEAMMRMQGAVAQQFFAPFVPNATRAADPSAHWNDVGQRLQAMWQQFANQHAATPDNTMATPPSPFGYPAQWAGFMRNWYQQMPLADPDTQQRLWNDGLKLWGGIVGQYGIGPSADDAPPSEPDLPRKDRRFADPKWREQPAFALIHQTYLMLAEQIAGMVDKVDGLDDAQRDQLRFTTRTVLDALSPAHFPLTNPLVLERTLESGGENLIKGMEHLIADLTRGQLTHTDPNAFQLGKNIAVTPGKVVHETPLYQLIQYSPTTEKVLETPLVIFPPWINRFYILDLNPKKSFVRWAVERGLTVFIVSWKSADESMADVVWDDYIRAQMDAIDHIRERLGVQDVHTIGYCVAGTTLAATLAILARRGEAHKVRSVTFFTAQVDFEEAGELKLFVDDAQLAMIDQASRGGFLDGRVMAATFNLLRGPDLIWNYVVNNYLLGEDYPAFDLLHWNGDVTNLPGKWHQSYLKDLYRDNRLVIRDELSADGTPIDLTLVNTPAYVQAGKEDHIAPAASVFKLTQHLAGPVRFVLAGSGHIAGVVNPPDAGKYQYWTNSDPKVDTLAAFQDDATEHPGSWWPNWYEWLIEQGDNRIAAKGKRRPGMKGDGAIEDAPGRYVMGR